MAILLTNACQYAGPGSVPALLRQASTLYVHDRAFTDPAIRQRYAAEHPGAHPLSAQDPEALAAELAANKIGIDTVIHNDVHPNSPLPIEDIPGSHWLAAIDALLLFPVRLTQCLLPAMKRAGSGRFVFVTSARQRQPESGFAVATSIRAATTAFALALAREAAVHGIQVNVVAPNYLYSEAYYPRARFIDDPAGRAQIAAAVPLGRLGTPEETVP